MKLHEYYYHNFTPEKLVEPTERCVITDQVEHVFVIGILDMVGLAMVKDLVHYVDGGFSADHDHHMCMVKMFGLAKPLRVLLGGLTYEQELCELDYGVRKLTTFTSECQEERSNATKYHIFRILKSKMGSSATDATPIWP